MGIRALRQIAFTALRAIEPVRRTDERFVVYEDAQGPVDRIDDFTGMVPFRRVDMRLSGLPRDDGEAGADNRRVRTGYVVRAAYRVDGDIAEVEDVIAEDLERILQALVNLPLSAGYGAAGGHSTSIPGQPTSQTYFSKPDARPMGVVVSIPFDIIYAEV